MSDTSSYTPAGMSLEALIESIAPVAGSETRQRILQAALTCFLEFGIRRTTIETVARRAGLGRATVYRAFADKGALVQAVVLHECAKSMREIARELAKIEDIEQRFVEAMVLTALGASNHPLVRRLFDIDAEWLLPYFTVDGSQSFELGRIYAASHLRDLQAQGHFTHLDADDVAELCSRLLHSLVLTPGNRLSGRDETSLRRYMHDFLLPLLRGSTR